MSSSRQTGSPPPSSPPGSSPRYHDMTCGSCGTRWVGGSGCPSCGGFGKAGEEVTKKTFDEPDLKKGW